MSVLMVGENGTIVCPEHGAMLTHNVVSKKAGEGAEQNILQGQREMRVPKNISVEQALYELGF